MPGRRLVVVSERDHNFIDLDDKTLLRVGRAPDNDIVVKDDMVSRRHCQIEISPDALRVRDLKSFNGTYLNERRIRDETLGPWDALRVGRTKMILVDRDADAPPIRGPGGTIADEPLPPPGPEDMGKTRTMDLEQSEEGVAALLTNKELRSAVEGIVRREREELERQISRRIRDESGPSVLASLHGFKVRVRRVGPVDGGGDLFDVFREPLRPRDLSMCLGSVSGVGIAACIAATTARHTLRGATSSSDEENPRVIVEGLVEVLSHTLHPGSALSLLLARLSESGKVQVGAMGGTGALHYKAASDSVEVLRAPGRRDEEAVRAEGLEATLRDGDVILLASDGAGASRNKAGDPYGSQKLQDRLVQLLGAGKTPKEALGELTNDYVAYSDGTPERDVTLMVLSRVSG